MNKRRGTTATTMRELLGPQAREYAEGRMRIPVDALLRIEWPEDSIWPGEKQRHRLFTHGAHFRHCYPRGARETKRLAYLHISSYTEIGSAGAIHWYASIEGRVSIGYDMKLGACGGYTGKATPKWWAESIKIEVRRKIRSRERDANGERLGRVGEMTGRLDTKAQARELAIKTFKRRFGPGWMLVDNRNDDAIVAET